MYNYVFSLRLKGSIDEFSYYIELPIFCQKKEQSSMNIETLILLKLPSFVNLLI